MARTSFALVLLGIAGAMALTLAIVGVYGVLAYAVGQRRREVGIRLALGAEPRVLKWLFVRKGLILNCVGAVIGLALAAALSRWISSLLFGITPLDPLTYVASAASSPRRPWLRVMFPPAKPRPWTRWRRSAANRCSTYELAAISSDASRQMPTNGTSSMPTWRSLLTNTWRGGWKRMRRARPLAENGATPRWSGRRSIT